MNAPKFAGQVKPGVIAGDDLQALFALAKAGHFALPAINVINTSTVNAVMEAAAEIKSPAILQFSNGGAAKKAQLSCDLPFSCSHTLYS